MMPVHVIIYYDPLSKEWRLYGELLDDEVFCERLVWVNDAVGAEEKVIERNKTYGGQGYYYLKMAL